MVNITLDILKRNRVDLNTSRFDLRIFIRNNYPRQNIEEIEDKIFDVDNFPNLIYLDLRGCNLSDLSFLNNLPKLIVLYLQDNKITDLSVLAKVNLPKLTELHLGNNEIEDISALAGTYFPKLVYLFLNGNKIEDLFGLAQANLPQIQQLFLNDNPIEVTLRRENDENIGNYLERLRNYYVGNVTKSAADY